MATVELLVVLRLFAVVLVWGAGGCASALVGAVRQNEDLPGVQEERFLMAGLKRKDFWLLSVIAGAVVGMAIAVLVGLSNDQERPSLSIVDVEGVWTASGGQRLTVRADGSAELERVSEPDEGCGQSASEINLSYTGPATWVFDSWPDESPGIRLDYIGAGTGKKCSIYLAITNTNIGVRGFTPHDPSIRYERSTSGSSQSL
ncbi:hypothetical protein [Streptomyces sp. NPDC090056]|uniref:hypothetical protein n=1 Tax=Streptomyces sp. NPDC090056 TaxID=3365934 RepID=UPI003803D746